MNRLKYPAALLGISCLFSDYVLSTIPITIKVTHTKSIQTQQICMLITCLRFTINTHKLINFYNSTAMKSLFILLLLGDEGLLLIETKPNLVYKTIQSDKQPNNFCLFSVSYVDAKGKYTRHGNISWHDYQEIDRWEDQSISVII